MTSTDTAGLAVGALSRARRSARRAGRRDGASPGDAHRHGLGAAARAAARARADRSRVEPLRGNVETRLRKMRERGLDAIVLAACGLDRLGLAAEIGAAARARRRCFPRRRRARSRCRCGPARRSWSRTPIIAETRRRVELERRCVAAVGAGCLAPVGAHHDGATLRALIADEDGAWIERAEGDDPAQVAAALLAARAARLARMKVIVTRPRDQAEPLVERLEALGRRRRRVPADRDRAHVRRADRRRRVRLARRHEPERRGRDRPAGSQPAAGSPPSGRAPPRRCARTGSSRPSCPTESSQEGLLREFPQAGGPRALRRRRGSSRGTAIDGLGADFVSLYRTRLLDARAAGRRRRRARLRLGGARLRGDRRPAAGGLDRRRDVARRPRRRARRSSPRRARPTSMGSSPRCAI